MASALNLGGLVTRPATWATLVVALGFGGPFALASPQQARGQTPSQPTFRGGVEIVSVSITVRDKRGKVISDLKRGDFEIIDSGQQRDIKDFHPGDAAISLSVLLDISGSMAVGGNIDRARQAVNIGLGQLQSGRDEAALFTFDSELQEVRGFTSDLRRVTSASLAGTPWGMTSLYDAIASTARLVAKRANRHRAVLVITDGVDTGSTMTAPEVSGLASSIDVPVYLLVVSNPVDNPEHDLTVIAADNLATETTSLADLARWTGGDLATVSAFEDSVEVLRTLIGELRHQYLITFEPGAAPGWHPLEIRARKKGLIVRARSGYIAGPGRSGS